MARENQPQKSSLHRLLIPALVVTTVVTLDQISKWIIIRELQVFDGRPVEVIPGLFNLVLTYNRGAAFGLLSDVPDGWRHLLLGLTTVAAFLAVAYFLLNDYRHDLMAHQALAMIVGGAIGNIIDRVRLGAVVDFLDVYYASYHWPAFNLADSAICVGVAVLLIRTPRKKTTSNPA